MPIHGANNQPVVKPEEPKVPETPKDDSSHGSGQVKGSDDKGQGGPATGNHTDTTKADAGAKPPTDTPEAPPAETAPDVDTEAAWKDAGIDISKFGGGVSDLLKGAQGQLAGLAQQIARMAELVQQQLAGDTSADTNLADGDAVHSAGKSEEVTAEKQKAQQQLAANASTGAVYSNDPKHHAQNLLEKLSGLLAKLETKKVDPKKPDAGKSQLAGKAATRGQEKAAAKSGNPFTPSQTASNAKTGQTSSSHNAQQAQHAAGSAEQQAQTAQSSRAQAAQTQATGEQVAAKTEGDAAVDVHTAEVGAEVATQEGSETLAAKEQGDVEAKEAIARAHVELSEADKEKAEIAKQLGLAHVAEEKAEGEGLRQGTQVAANQHAKEKGKPIPRGKVEAYGGKTGKHDEQSLQAATYTKDLGSLEGGKTATGASGEYAVQRRQEDSGQGSGQGGSRGRKDLPDTLQIGMPDTGKITDGSGQVVAVAHTGITGTHYNRPDGKLVNVYNPGVLLNDPAAVAKLEAAQQVLREVRSKALYLSPDATEAQAGAAV